MTFRLLPSQFLSAAASLAVATSVWASPMDIAERLDVAPVIEGHFVQTEKLVLIPQPFQCEGFFIFWENDVLLWKTKFPVATTSLYNDKTFKTYIHLNGKRIENSSASVTNVVNRILWGLLSTDITALELDFQIFTQNNENGWRMDFFPKSNMTGSIVKHISVTGNRIPERIVVENFSNDITTLVISDIKLSETSSSRQENELANP